MKNSRNALHFMFYNAPYAGNFIKSLVKLETRMKGEEVEMVYLFARETADKQWVRDLIKEEKAVYFLTGKGLSDLLLLQKIVKKHNIEIVHSHFVGMRYQFYLKLIKKFNKGKLFVIYHLHNHYHRNNFVIEFLKSRLSSVDLYIGCSKSVADHHQRTFRIEERKVTYVPNAIDFSRLNHYEHFNKDKQTINNRTKKLLVFGFDYYRKGVDIVIEAISELVNENNDVCLLLSLSTNRSFVEAKIKERFNEIPSWIKILEPRDDIASYYASSDAFISCSRSEGFCYSLVEAAYCETPIIASDIPGQNSLNIPYTYQFPSENVKKLKEQILGLLSLNYREKLERGKIQKEFVLKTFDLGVWSESILNIYKSF